jgi:hypothetical protein
VRRWLLALLISVVALPCAHAREAALVIEDCLTKLDPAADIGYARIVARCPDLPGALSQSSVAAWLPADWNRPDNQLSAAGLTELRLLLTQVPTEARRPAPRVAGVAGLLATLVQSERAHSSWWDRFRQWLRHILAPQPTQEENWLQRLVVTLFTSNAADTIAWTSLTLVVALALGIIANELRLAGFLRSGERSLRRRRAEPAPGGEPAGLEQIARAPPAEQPRMLLEFIARRLAEQQRLPPARALTTLELTQRARLPAEERASLAALASVCERVRFSGCEVPGTSLAAAIARGKSLLATLELGAPAAAQAA